MSVDSQNIALLSDSLIDEIVGAVGLPKNRFTHRLGRSIFRKITDRFANIGAPFDETVGSEGLPKASEFCLNFFCNEVKTDGIENVPLTGPLLVTTNHPGTYDGLTIYSKLPRKDIKWISSEIPFLRLLPNLSEHILFASRQDSRSRMVVLRNAIQHLQQGGVLVYFAAGHRDPDPAVYPGASKAIDGWLDIFDTFFKYVPELLVQPVIVSGVVSGHWSKHWFPRIRRKQIDQQRLAEFGQVISQLMHPGRIYLSPSVSFGKPMEKTELSSTGVPALAAVIAEAKKLLKHHCEIYGGNID
jgi:1-acyl-sn-glycerol-3-phosphate acyltransferase